MITKLLEWLSSRPDQHTPMSESIIQQVPTVSDLAENLVGSEIIKIAGEINARISQGEDITNLTIGDFNPAI